MPRSSSAGGPADSAAVKATNLMLVWRCVQREAPIGRIEIAQRTGLSKGSLTALAGQLIDLGLVRSLGAAEGTGRGRRIDLLAPDGSAKAVVAVQVRLEDLVVQANDLGGAERYRTVARHGRPMGDPDAIARQIAAALRRCEGALREQNCRLVRGTVVMAAPLWGDPPIVPASVDFGWQETDLLHLVAGHLDASLQLRLENDATAAIRAERAALAHRPRSMLYLKSRTGIGGAAIVNDEVMTGAHGMAFEPGHLVVADSPACGCGQRGCLVTHAGPEVVLARAGLAALAVAAGSRTALAELVERWRLGDRAACDAVDDLTRWMARAITQLRIAFDPELIVLGGYWASLTAPVAGALARSWSELGGIFASRWRTDLVRPAVLGERGAVRGALLADGDAAVRSLFAG